MQSSRALVRAFPGAKVLPHVPIGVFPTPVDPLDLRVLVPGFDGRAWVKREDRSGTPLGGNKIRKLELLLGDALSRGASWVVTTGGIGSNHALAVAHYAPDVGLEPHLVIFPHDVTATSRRTLAAIAASGAGITYAPSGTLCPAVAAMIHARLNATRRPSYLIAPGGSSVTGALGWVDAGLEIAEQIGRGELDAPDAVFVPYGSGGTAAGLAAGLHLAGIRCEVVAVRVYDLPATTELWLRVLARRAVRKIGRVTGERIAPLPDHAVRVLDGYLGRRYAAPTEAGSAAREAGAELGLELEPTYSAKAFAAFLDAAASPAYRDRRLLFVQTYDARVPDAPAPDTVAELLPRLLRRFV